MARRNRVFPTGEIVATPERGTLMGGGGVLHDARGNIVRPWQLKRWIVCVLEFRGRWRAVMTPGRYTELFFLDEATALAAGHRPCAECQRSRFDEFRAVWRAGCTAVEMDQQLHAERVGEDRSKRTFEAGFDEMPDGVFVLADGSPMLLWGGRLLTWSPGGYGEARRPDGRAKVLTPASIVRAIREGFTPSVHPSA